MILLRDYRWRDLDNAVGFAGDCAQMATEHARSKVVEAGGTAIRANIRASAKHARDAHIMASSAADADGTNTPYKVTEAAAEAAVWAGRAGVPKETIDQALFATIASDLGLRSGSDKWHAVIAAVSIDNIELAQEIAGL